MPIRAASKGDLGELAVNRELDETSDGPEAGVVHQHVDRPSVSGFGFGQAPFDRSLAGFGLEVGDEHLDLGAMTSQFASQRIEPVGATGHDDEVVTVAGGEPGQLLADPPRRTRDERQRSA